MRQSHLNDPLPRYEIRIERLKKLLKAVKNNENALIHATSSSMSSPYVRITTEKDLPRCFKVESVLKKLGNKN